MFKKYTMNHYISSKVRSETQKYHYDQNKATELTSDVQYLWVHLLHTHCPVCESSALE